MKRPRLRKWAKWACTLAAAVCVGVTAFSVLYSSSYATLTKGRTALRLVDLGHGVLWIDERPDWSRGRTPPPPRWEMVRSISWRCGFSEDEGAVGAAWEWYAGVRYRRTPRGWDLGLSLLHPALLAAVSAAVLWYADRRRFGPGRCEKCGYDRHGLGEDAKCPECGAAARPRGGRS